MSRYKVERLEGAPTSQDMECLLVAVEDCLASAARDIDIHDKSTYLQYQNIMEVFNNHYAKLAEAYFEAHEIIAMHAGQTDLGKRFEKLDADKCEGYDRMWYKMAYQAVKKKNLTKKLLRKKRFGF